MTSASTPSTIQIAHPEPAQLQEDQPGREHPVHLRLPDHRDRATVAGGGGAAGEAERVRAAAIQRQLPRRADPGTDREVLRPGEGDFLVPRGIREAEQDLRDALPRERDAQEQDQRH